MLSLPRPATPLLGRREELASLLAQLRSGTRLVTITGLGGIGKTRLALAVADTLANERAVTYCDAAACTGLDDLADALALALAVELPAQLSRLGPLDALALVTRDLAPHVLVLDNSEAIAAMAAPAIERWLARSPATSLLVTSRRSLGSPSEHLVALGPLPPATATELLLARARQRHAEWGKSDETRVARLAARLDGLPLVIELVAANARVAGPAELEAMISSRPTKSLADAARTAVGWSWASLEPALAADLTRLAGIDGAFDAALAAATLGLDLGATLERLAVLTRDSLLTIVDDGAVSYRLLDTVRAFVAEVGDATHLADGVRAATAAVLARTRALLDRTPSPSTRVAFARDRERLHEHLARGLGTSDPELLHVALQVIAIHVIAFRREHIGVAPVGLAARVCAAMPAQTGVPVAVRIAAAEQIVRYGFNVPEDDWHVFLLTAERWYREAGDERAIARLEIAAGLRLFHDWRYRGLDELMASVRARPGVREPKDEYLEIALAAFARRGLGLADESDELALEAIEQRLPDPFDALDARINRTFLAVQLARPDGLVRARAVWRETVSNRLPKGEIYALRELARAELEAGHHEAAVGYYREALRGFAESYAHSRDVGETRVELAAALLEAGRIEAASALLHDADDWANERFAKTFTDALRGALEALRGEPAIVWPNVGPTDTVEDAGFAIYGALGSSRLAAVIAASAAAAACSTRVRVALRIGRAFLAAMQGEVLAVALDHGAFRRGQAWVDVSNKPVMRVLLATLVEAWLEDRKRRLDKDTLGAILWPGERLAPEHRDNRLHVVVSNLRKAGLGDMLVHDGAGFALDPKGALVRCAVSAMPDQPSEPPPKKRRK